MSLHHEDDTGVGLVECVSVKQSFAGDTQLHLRYAGNRATEASYWGYGLLDVVHPGLGPEEGAATEGQAVAAESSLGGRGLLGLVDESKLRKALEIHHTFKTIFLDVVGIVTHKLEVVFYQLVKHSKSSLYISLYQGKSFSQSFYLKMTTISSL